MKFTFTLLLIYYSPIFMSAQNAIVLGGKVIEKSNNKPLAFTNISFTKSNRGTISNQDGLFELLINSSEIQDTLIISHLGYSIIKKSVKDVLASDSSLFVLELVGYQLPTVVIGGLEGKELIEKCLDRIDDNYPGKDHVLRGFYYEEVKLTDDKNLTYGEGVVEVYKKKYKDNPDLRYVNRLQQGEEFAVFKKGFYEEFTEVKLYNPVGDEVKFPDITQGGAVAKILDFLKSGMSFLLKENKNKYRFSAHSITITGQEEAYVVDFTHLKDTEGYDGKVTIHADNYAILKVEATASEEVKKNFHESYPALKLLDRTFNIEYTKNGEKYTLAQARADNKFYFIPTGDTLINHIVFTTTDRITKDLPKYNYSERLAENQPMYYGLPINQDYWEGENTILRTKKINDLVHQRVIKREKEMGEFGTRVNFLKYKYKDIVHAAKNANKFIFVDIYTNWCPPCKKMDRLTMKDKEVIKHLNTFFLAQKVNLEDNRNHPLVRELNVRSIPTFVIVLPWGEVLHSFKGFKSAKDLMELLRFVTTKVDLEELQAIKKRYENDEGLREKMISRAIYLQTQNGPFAIRRKHLEKYMGSIDSWKRSEEKLRFLFYDLLDNAQSEFADFFLDNHKLYKLYLPNKKVNQKLYDIGFSRNISNKKKRKDFVKYAQKYLVDSLDYFLTRYEIDYHNVLNNPDKYAVAVLNHYERFPAETWDHIKVPLLDALLELKDKENLNRAHKLLMDYKELAVTYEWMDVYSVYLYQIGDHQQAYTMVPEVVKMARAEGKIYKSALHLLKNK